MRFHLYGKLPWNQIGDQFLRAEGSAPEIRVLADPPARFASPFCVTIRTPSQPDTVSVMEDKPVAAGCKTK
jgi:hypothetical protein